MPTSPAILLVQLKASGRIQFGGLRPSAAIAKRMSPASEALATLIAAGTVGLAGYGALRYADRKVQDLAVPQFDPDAARDALSTVMYPST